MANEMLAARFKVPGGFVIPEEDDARLRTLLNLKIEDDQPVPELPDEIVAGYYAMKRCCDMLGCGVTDWQIATVVLFALLAGSEQRRPVELVPEMPPDFRAIVKQKRTPMGALVAAEFGGEIKPGFFCGFVGDEVEVQIAGVSRCLALDKVRLAGKNEFPELPRNVNKP